MFQKLISQNETCDVTKHKYLPKCEQQLTINSTQAQRCQEPQLSCVCMNPKHHEIGESKNFLHHITKIVMIH